MEKTLRDEIAIEFLKIYLEKTVDITWWERIKRPFVSKSCVVHGDFDKVAKASYTMADAMLRERGGTP